MNLTIFNFAMVVPATASKIAANSTKINTLLKTVSDEINGVSSALGDIGRRIRENRIDKLKRENEELEKRIQAHIQELRDLRLSKGIPQICTSKVKFSGSSNVEKPTHATPDTESKVASSPSSGSDKPKVNQKKEKNAKAQPKEKKSIKQAAQPEKEEEAHIGRLDIRVGRIVDVEKHPNADTLYVEKVDLGEAKPRTIISGLVKHFSIEEMRNRLALFLINLKPAKMRGIDSEGMIMAANLDGKVEILIPPEGVQPGDYVTVDGYERNPDAQLSAKKKTFELVQVDMKTNDKREACYKGTPWNVAGKGPAISPTLAGASIK